MATPIPNSNLPEVIAVDGAPDSASKTPSPSPSGSVTVSPEVVTDAKDKHVSGGSGEPMSDGAQKPTRNGMTERQAVLVLKTWAKGI